MQKPQNQDESQDKPSRKKKILRELKILFFLTLGVFAFRSSFFEPFRIPSGSMIPTLMIGDFILVNKFSYGIKVPFSNLALLGINWDPIYLFGMDDPQRGDVIVFKYPEDPSINYVKRVIGLPGETLEIRDKVVYINDKPLLSKEISGKEIMEDMDDRFKRYNFKFYQNQTGETSHVTQVNPGNIFQRHYGPVEIPPGHFFAMGDNRDFSEDSRSWGFVPKKNIKGKAILVWFSMIFFPFQNMKARFHRIGAIIK